MLYEGLSYQIAPRRHEGCYIWSGQYVNSCSGVADLSFCWPWPNVVAIRMERGGAPRRYLPRRAPQRDRGLGQIDRANAP